MTSPAARAPPAPPPPPPPLAARLWDLLQPLARLWGVITAVVMSGAGAELAAVGSPWAPGVLAAAAAVLVLETLWVAALFVDLLGRRGHYSAGLRAWDMTRWAAGRARAPLYACAATALLLAALTALCTASGGMLLVLALLRAAVPFSPHATHGVHSPRAGSSLLSQHDLADVFYSAAGGADHEVADDKTEEMTVLESARPAPPPPPPPALLEL